MWKQKLRSAIDSGECESTPYKVKRDYNCAFGKWLHQRIDADSKESDYYPEVVNLHAKFHEEAGGILELALDGDKEQANKLMGIGQPLAKYSAALTIKMKAW
jgi:methyl-accepting chemotaxis protein